eukprot:1857024-Heterocapsa_arctica.AAC.1
MAEGLRARELLGDILSGGRRDPRAELRGAVGTTPEGSPHPEIRVRRTARDEHPVVQCLQLVGRGLAIVLGRPEVDRREVGVPALDVCRGGRREVRVVALVDEERRLKLPSRALRRRRRHHWALKGGEPRLHRIDVDVGVPRHTRSAARNPPDDAPRHRQLCELQRRERPRNFLDAVRRGHRDDAGRQGPQPQRIRREQGQVHDRIREGTNLTLKRGERGRREVRELGDPGERVHADRVGLGRVPRHAEAAGRAGEGPREPPA